MKFWLYKALLVLFKGLIQGKRALFWLGRLFGRGLGKLRDLYAETLGFWLYKGWYSVNRKLGRYKIPLDGRMIDLFGKRGTLQVVLVIVALFIVFPNSQLHTKDFDTVAGRKTLLYQLVGPGDLDYAIDDLIVEEVIIGANQEGTIPAWQQGAAVIESPSQAGKEVARGPQEITSISAGGSALSKPTILSGNELPADPEEQTQENTGRSKVVEYTVQPGDVIGKIAQQFGIDVNTILWSNNLSARSLIRPGDTLDIMPVSGVLHTVKRGETISKIARQYDAEQAKIIAYNKLQKDGSDIVIGEKLIIPDGIKPAARPTIVQRTSSAISQKLSNIVPPPPSVERPAGSGYIWPTAAKIITQYSHWRHVALDIGGPMGTPIYASQAGKVVKSQCGWNGGYGCYIILDHGNGVQTLYAHHSELLVSVGQQVSPGQTIALMGSTGRSTGPHLHYEIRVGGKRQNPLRYVRQ